MTTNCVTCINAHAKNKYFFPITFSEIYIFKKDGKVDATLPHVVGLAQGAPSRPSQRDDAIGCGRHGATNLQRWCNIKPTAAGVGFGAPGRVDIPTPSPQQPL